MQTETQREYEQRILAVVTLIERRLDDPPGYRELAEVACLSPYHFHRIFRAMVGESPTELTRRLRLERAAWWLRTTGRSITEIAFASDYGTHQAFTKAFTELYRCSPTDFRHSVRLCWSAVSECSLHFDRGHFTPLRFLHQIWKAGLTMKLEVVDLPTRRIAAVTHIGPYNQIGDAFVRLCHLVGMLGLFAHTDPAPTEVAIYSDDPDVVPVDKLTSVAGIYVPEGIDIGELKEVWQTGGRFLQATHEGSYATLGAAWGTLYGELIPAGGYTLREGPCFEIYAVANHAGSPDQLRTHLCVPIV